MVKNKAFTLAEVLITLIIIGVIAVLTIPNLMQKYKEQVTVNKVKKFYSTLNDAFQQAIQVNGTVDNWNIKNSDTTSAETIFKFLFENYFKITKDCGINNNEKCIIDDYYKTINGENNSTKYSISNSGYSYYKFVLDDGSAIITRGYKSVEQGTNPKKYIAVFIDINGKNPPNKWGYDLFGFNITENKVYPGGAINKSINLNKECSVAKNLSSCTAWLIYKGNMDYLHCDDLSWNGKSKCSK